MSHTPRRVLVTGAAGRLGRVVLRELAARAATRKLLDRWLPEVPRRAPLPGRTVPVDLTAARTLLGFTAEHLFHQGPLT